MNKFEFELLKAKVDMLEQQVGYIMNDDQEVLLDYLMNGNQEVKLDDTPSRQSEEEWKEYAQLWIDGVNLLDYE